MLLCKNKRFNQFLSVEHLLNTGITHLLNLQFLKCAIHNFSHNVYQNLYNRQLVYKILDSTVEQSYSLREKNDYF